MQKERYLKQMFLSPVFIFRSNQTTYSNHNAITRNMQQKNHLTLPNFVDFSVLFSLLQFFQKKCYQGQR